MTTTVPARAEVAMPSRKASVPVLRPQFGVATSLRIIGFCVATGTSEFTHGRVFWAAIGAAIALDTELNISLVRWLIRKG